MGLLDGLEKLITEHGSAAILKERIALANDKYAALETKASDLETENKRLRAENEEIRQKLQALEARIGERGVARLDEEQEKLMLLLAQHAGITTEQVAGSLRMNPELAEFHLTELHERDLLSASYSMMSPTTWGLGHEGRRYLVKNGLLK
jgi:septal ring factor EnvC (AmiA/AmiB activator)